MRVKNDDLSGLLSIQDSTRTRVCASISMKKKADDSRKIAKLNDASVLLSLRIFGHLRISEIARYSWPKAMYSEQMALRTVKRLLVSGLVVSRRNSVGGMSYVLTRRGAQMLELSGFETRHGLDLSSVSGGTFLHRTISTRYLIEQKIKGFDVVGEYGLNLNRTPFYIHHWVKQNKKMPDGIFWRSNSLGGYVTYIVETEHASKPLEEIIRVLKTAEHVGNWIDHEKTAQICGLVIVFDASLNHANRILRAANNLWKHLPVERRKKLESSVKLVFANIRLPLVWENCTEKSLAQYRIENK
jgi:predicted DNA-binding transcriptional regulator